MRAFLLLIGVIATSALALAGCGAEEAAKKLDPVAEAADRTMGAGSAQIDGEMTMQVPGQGEMTLLVDGAADFAKNRVRMTMRAGDDAPPEVKQVFPMTVAMEGTTLYQRIPGLERHLPDGKTWMKVDVEEATGSELPQEFGTGDPAAMLETLKRAGDAEKVGTERIDGEEMTHYRAAIDPQQILEASTTDLSPRVRRQIEAMGDEKVPVDVWIDSEGRLRRQVQTMKVPAGGQSVETRADMRFHGFDEDVRVELPDEDDVHDATDEVEGQLGG